MNTVLIVDDEAHIRQVLHRMLSGRNWHTLEATGSLDVFDICASQADIDLMVIDDLLPCDSGVRITERLLRSHPNLEVILCPALPLDFWPESERNILERLPKDHLRWLYKPFTWQQFLKTVAEAENAPDFAQAA